MTPSDDRLPMPNRLEVPAVDERQRAEARLVAAAEKCGALCRLLGKFGARADRARLEGLRDELGALPLAVQKVCDGWPATDLEIDELTQRYEKTTSMLFGEINTGQEKCF